MRLLRLISWPYARRHALRSLLTTAGIVLGVAVFVGMHTANQSVLAAFHQTIDRIAGSAQLQVSAGEPGFDEEVVDRVRAVAGVAAAAPVVENSVAIGGSHVLILGVDMLGDRSVRQYDLEGADAAIDDPLVFLAQPDSLIVTQSLAAERGLAVGSRIPLKTMQGDRSLTVRGVMKPGGLASAFGGNLAIMDIYAAQKVFGQGYRFDRVDIVLDEGVDLNEGAARLRAALGPGFQVEPPSSRGEQFEATSRLYALASNVTSLFALFIGMFIIYNTFAIAVTQRRAEIGILRALGASRGQVRWLFLMESAVAGLAGTIAGVVFGIVLARGMEGYIGNLLEEVYGVAQRADQITISPYLIAAAVAMGVVTSVVAAILPARAAAGVDPAIALQKGRAQALTEGESRIRRRWALACAAASLAAFLFSRETLTFYAGFLLAVLAAVLLSPALALWLARTLRPALARLRPVEGTLAADSLIQAPRRTSGTVAALMLSLGLVVTLGGLGLASYNSLYEWMRVAFDPDLFVTAAETVSTRGFVFPPSLADELAAIDGVDAVHRARAVRVPIKGTPAMIVAVDAPVLERRTKLPPVEGDAFEMYRRTAAGQGLMASESFARLRGARLGEVLEIPAPSGTLRLPIVGIVRDYSDQQGSLLIARATYVRYWNDDSVNFFRVYVKPGTDSARVRRNILDTYAGRHRLFVLTHREVRDWVIRITDQWFGLTYVQIAVAVLVAVLGIVNALTVSIIDRRRELGVLQAVGGLRGQVRHTVWMEALAIGVIGLILGLALGAAQLFYAFEALGRHLVGMKFDYAYPFGTAAALVPVILGAAFLAGLGPAESAVRGSLVEALEYE
jgi:putative ABC transport system permease protein